MDKIKQIRKWAHCRLDGRISQAELVKKLDEINEPEGDLFASIVRPYSVEQAEATYLNERSETKWRKSRSFTEITGATFTAR